MKVANMSAITDFDRVYNVIQTKGVQFGVNLDNWRYEDVVARLEDGGCSRSVNVLGAGNLSVTQTWTFDPSFWHGNADDLHQLADRMCGAA
jgi:hypothetical protein